MRKLNMRWLPVNVKKQPVEFQRIIAGLVLFIAAAFSLTLILRKREEILDKIRALREHEAEPIVLKGAGTAA